MSVIDNEQEIMSPTSEGWGASDHTEDPVTNKSIDEEVELRFQGEVRYLFILMGEAAHGPDDTTTYESS